MSLATEKFAEATPNPNEKYCANQVVQRTLMDKTAKRSVAWNQLCKAEKLSTLKLLFRLVLQDISSTSCSFLHKLT